MIRTAWRDLSAFPVPVCGVFLYEGLGDAQGVAVFGPYRDAVVFDMAAAMYRDSLFAVADAYWGRARDLLDDVVRLDLGLS